MPVPKPNDGESQDDFISRCMGADAMQEYDQAQRAAICHQAWDDRNKSAPQRAKKIARRLGPLTRNEIVLVATGKADAEMAKRAPQVRPVSGGERMRAIDERARTIEFVASDGTVDRMGDIIDPEGWDLGSYSKNPVFLWGHDRCRPPIGRSLSHAVTDVNGRRALVQTIEFFGPGPTEHDQLADYAFRSYVRGGMSSVSVGFLPQQTTYIDDPNERTRLGLGPWGVLYNRQELLELSAVTVPANPSATVLGAKELAERGILTKRDIDALGALGVLAPFALREAERALGSIRRRSWVSIPDLGARVLMAVAGGAKAKDVGWVVDDTGLTYVVRDPAEFDGDCMDAPYGGDVKVTVCHGMLKDGGAMAIQSLKFATADGWTQDSATTWITDNLDAIKNWAPADDSEPDPADQNEPAEPPAEEKPKGLHADVILEAVAHVRDEIVQAIKAGHQAAAAAVKIPTVPTVSEVAAAAAAATAPLCEGVRDALLDPLIELLGRVRSVEEHLDRSADAEPRGAQVAPSGANPPPTSVYEAILGGKYDSKEARHDHGSASGTGGGSGGGGPGS